MKSGGVDEDLVYKCLFESPAQSVNRLLAGAAVMFLTFICMPGMFRSFRGFGFQSCAFLFRPLSAILVISRRSHLSFSERDFVRAVEI